MTFGKWSLALFSLVLLGFFIVQYIIPALAGTPTATNEINVTLNTPANGGYSKTANINFTYNISWNTVSANIINCSLMGNFSGGTWTNYSWNNTPIVNNVFNGINYTFSTDGPYSWNIYCYNITLGTGNYGTSNRTIIFDTTNPVLNTTTPRDKQFISGNDSQLFEVYVYDVNLNLANVSLFYQYSGAGTWSGSVGNMNCYAGSSSSQFICNTTVNDLWDNILIEGTQVNYYFEATDNATNFGSNGTSSSYNYVKIDRTAPANASAAEKIASGTGYWTPGANYGFQIDWTDTGGSGVSTVLFEHNFTTAGSLTNTTATPVSGNTYKVNFTQEQIVNASVGFAYRWYANDSVISLNKNTNTDSTNWAITSFSIYTINKNQSTSNFMNLTIGNGTTVAEANNGVMYPNANNVTGYYNSNVFSGQTITFTLYKNDSSVGASSDTTRYAGGTLYKYTYNTSGNANYTSASKEFWSTVVQNNTNPVDVYLNKTANTNLTVVYPAQVNVTYLFIYNSSSDNTGTPMITKISGGTETDYTSNNAQNVKLANGTYEFKVNITGNVNYTTNATGATFKAVVEKGATSITYYINGTTTSTSGTNKTIASGTAVNITVVADNSEGVVKLYEGGTQTSTDTVGASLSNVTTYSGSPRTEWNITGFYNGSQNYSASASIWNFIKIENTPPTYTNLAIIINSGEGHNITNNSIIGKNSGSFNISAQWNDGFALSKYWLSNNTVSEINTTAASFPTGNWTNITIFPSAYTAGTVLQIKIYANDTSGNENSTATYRYTIDGTAPSLTNPSPANNSYITRNSSYPFYITVTDNTLNTSNVTVYWGTVPGTYQWNDKMTCTGSPSTFTCTKDFTKLNDYPGNTTFYYYYEAYDNSSLVGRNGNNTNPNVITTDISAPQYSNNNTNVTVAGKYDTVLIYAYWTDADTLNTAVLETNETGSAANKTISQHALVTTFTGSSAWSNFTWSNSSLAVGTIIAWKIYANDSVGNQNVTSQGLFTIDGTKPTYTNNNTNVSSGSTIAKGTPILVYAQWNDNVNLHGWVVEHNQSGGILANTTFSTVFGTGNWTNYTITVTASVGGTVQARIFVNDTSGNENVTNTWTWTVDSTKPAYTNNGTNITSGETIVKGTPILIYAQWNDGIQLDKGWMEQNLTTGSLINTSIDFSGNWTNYTFPTSSLNLGKTYVARLFANDTSGNENVTNTWTWTIDGTAPTSANQSDSVSGVTVYAPGKTYILNISWTDNLGDSNVSKVILEWNGVTNYTSPDVKSLGSSNYSLTLADLAKSNYTYKWYANDTSNNWGVTSVYTLNVTQNTTNPIDIFIRNSTAAYKNTNVTEGAGQSITVNATAIYGNETELKLYQNDTKVGNPYTFTFLTAAVYLFKANITSTNYTSNETSTFYLTVTEDTTGPTILLYDYTNATVKKTGAQLTLNISVTDGSGVSQGETCNVTIAGVINRTITHSNGWCNGTIRVPTVPSDGNYVINITVKDNSTNHNEGFNASFVLTVDNTTPVVSISTPTNGVYKKSDGAGYIWINGTVYDLIQMGTGNVSINSSSFSVYNFTGGNNTGFSFWNSSAVADGYYALLVNYTDKASNTGQATVYFYVDNNATTSFTALTTGTKAKSATQSVQVNVTDNLMTNASITLNYLRGGLDLAWQTKTMTGTPAATTTYSAIIDTSILGDGAIVYYYVTGIDNATNQFSTNNGSAASPLSNFKVGVEDSTAPNVTLTSPSGTITDNTPTLVVNISEAGYCKYDTADKAMSSMANTMTGSGTGHEYTLPTLTDNYYTYYVRCNDTTGNEMSIGASIAFDLDTRSLWNITKPDTKYGYFTTNKWWSFALPLWTIQAYLPVAYYNVTSVLGSVNGNYNNFYADIGNNNTWRSYVPGRAVNSFTDFTYNGSASIYYIYVNNTDRLEITSIIT